MILAFLAVAADFTVVVARHYYHSHYQDHQNHHQDHQNYAQRFNLFLLGHTDGPLDSRDGPQGEFRRGAVSTDSFTLEMNILQDRVYST